MTFGPCVAYCSVRSRWSEAYRSEATQRHGPLSADLPSLCRLPAVGRRLVLPLRRVASGKAVWMTNAVTGSGGAVPRQQPGRAPEPDEQHADPLPGKHEAEEQGR